MRACPCQAGRVQRQLGPFGAKLTLDATYLARARTHGAEEPHGCASGRAPDLGRRLSGQRGERPRSGPEHAGGDGGSCWGQPARWAPWSCCSVRVTSSGTLPRLSPALGEGFSGNGDFIGTDPSDTDEGLIRSVARARRSPRCCAPSTRTPAITIATPTFVGADDGAAGRGSAGFGLRVAICGPWAQPSGRLWIPPGAAPHPARSWVVRPPAGSAAQAWPGRARGRAPSPPRPSPSGETRRRDAWCCAAVAQAAPWMSCGTTRVPTDASSSASNACWASLPTRTVAASAHHPCGRSAGGRGPSIRLGGGRRSR